MRMIEVCLFALGVGAGYGLSTLSFYMGNKMANNVVSNFTSPVQVEQEPQISSEVNPIYDFQQYEDTLKEYIGTDIDTKEEEEPNEDNFQPLN